MLTSQCISLTSHAKVMQRSGDLKAVAEARGTGQHCKGCPFASYGYRLVKANSVCKALMMEAISTEDTTNVERCGTFPQRV
jgi:hypothetical protein